jgi:hypothetical protein
MMKEDLPRKADLTFKKAHFISADIESCFHHRNWEVAQNYF